MELADEIVRVLQSAKIGDHPPVFRAKDLAEKLDVTPQTIRNHVDDAERHPGVRSGKIGKAQVWWFDNGKAHKERNVDLEEEVAKNRQYSWERVLGDRAKWLDMRQALKSSFRSGGRSDRKQVAALWHLNSYLQWATSTWVNYDRIFNDMVGERDLFGGEYDPENQTEEYKETVSDEPFSDTPGSLTADQLEYYGYHAHCFTTRSGEDIVGLGEFSIPYMVELRKVVRDDSGNANLENADFSEIRPLLPQGRDLIGFGDLVDEIITEGLEIRW